MQKMSSAADSINLNNKTNSHSISLPLSLTEQVQNEASSGQQETKVQSRVEEAMQSGTNAQLNSIDDNHEAAVRKVMSEDYDDEDNNIKNNNNEYYDKNDVEIIETNPELVYPSRVSVLRNQFFADLDACSQVNPRRKASLNKNVFAELQQEYFMGRPTVANATPSELSSSGNANSLYVSSSHDDSRHITHEEQQLGKVAALQKLLLSPSSSSERQEEKWKLEESATSDTYGNAQREKQTNKKLRRVSFKTGSTDRQNCSANNNDNDNAGIGNNVNENTHLNISPFNLLQRTLGRVRYLYHKRPVAVTQSENIEEFASNVNAHGVSVASNTEGMDGGSGERGGGGGGVNSFVRSARLERCSMLTGSAAAGALMYVIVKRGVSTILTSLAVTQILILTGYAHVRWHDLISDVCSCLVDPLHNNCTSMEVACADIHVTRRWQRVIDNVRTYQASKIAFCLGVLASYLTFESLQEFMHFISMLKT